MSIKKKVIEINIEKVNTALDNYFTSVDTAKKAQLSVQETVQAFSKAVGFNWWEFGLKTLSEKHPQIANVFKENVLNRYLNDNVGIDSVKMGDIEYNFSTENILYDKAKDLKEKFPNAELYAYLNDNKTGLRRKVAKFTNHAYNELKELAEPKKDTNKDKEDKEEKTRNQLTAEVIDKEIAKYRNACTGKNPTMSSQECNVKISVLEDCKRKILA
jgi:hypothetical protein